MVKITVRIDGMACGMCESHVNDAIRRSFKVKKVSSSHTSGCTEIICESEIDRSQIENALKDTGYTVLDTVCVPYEKKKLFSFGK